MVLYIINILFSYLVIYLLLFIIYQLFESQVYLIGFPIWFTNTTFYLDDGLLFTAVYGLGGKNCLAL
jgi:hypothetical protein